MDSENQNKEAVKHNAFKHGLRGKEFFLDLENYKEEKESLDLIRDGLIASFNPIYPFEFLQIESMSIALFKLGRYERLESQSFENASTKIFDFGGIFETSPEQKERDKKKIYLNDFFEKYSKYKSLIDNQFQKSLENLIKFRQCIQFGLFGNKGE